MMARREDRERIPQSLQGLLRMTTQQAREAETPSVFEEMSEERKQWLKEAISTFSEDTYVKRMQECLTILEKDKGDDDDDNSAKESAFVSLVDMVDLIDNANDLHKIGGFPIVVKYLRCDQSELRWRAAELIAVLSQNNAYSQVHLNQMGVIPVLIELLNHDPTEQVKIKALHALSSITSNFPEGKKVFMDHDGLSSLIKGLQGNIHKVRMKSSTMLRTMISESVLTDSNIKDTLVNMGIVEQLVALLHGDHELFHEYILDGLVVLASNCPTTIQQCQRPELQLEKVLNDKIHQLEKEDKDAFESEIEYSKTLLKLCFGNKTGQDNDNTLR